MPMEYDNWEDQPYQCGRCNWSGRGSELQMGDLFSVLYEMCCPRCNEKVELITIPTWEEKRQNWDKLSEGEKRRVERFEAHLQEFERRKLWSPDQLPDLEGEDLVLIWDFEERKDKDSRETLVKLGDQVLWREPAVYEGYWRFIQVAQILSLKYGARLKDLVPTEESTAYLHGDIHGFESFEQVEYCRQLLQRKHDEGTSRAEGAKYSTEPSLMARLMNPLENLLPSYLRDLPVSEALEALVGMFEQSYVGGRDTYINVKRLGGVGRFFAKAQVVEAPATAIAWMGREDAAERREIVGGFLWGFYHSASATENEVAALLAAAARCEPGTQDYAALVGALALANASVGNAAADVFLRRQETWLRKMQLLYTLSVIGLERD